MTHQRQSTTPRWFNERSTRRAGAIALCSTACACATLGGCTKALAPTFMAVGVREIEVSNERSVIEFSIEATNPNRDPIPLRQIHYTVRIDGTEVFSGVRSPETTLHTYSSHVFGLPAVIPVGSLSGSGEISYSLIGTAQYIPPGRLSEVLFDAEIKVPEATIDLTGTINASGKSSGSSSGTTGDD